MNFNQVAPHYRWLETLVFGRKLQEARIAFVRQIAPPRRVLVAGEGNGRFLAEFVRAHPGAEVDCVEASARMIALARRRIQFGHVQFICADLREAKLQRQSYDLLVTHFFLDCFAEQGLPGVVAKLAGLATADAQWLIADFCEPATGWARFQARGLIAAMYFFFRVTAGIEGRRLFDYQPLVRSAGFCLTSQRLSANGMIRSQLWQRK
ncbi:MAG TPA: class I SAM-dependent methyltransferase [Chthoniobacterales bacterium]